MFRYTHTYPGGGGGGGGDSDLVPTGGVPLKPPNPYPSLRVILAERVPIIRGFLFKKMTFFVYFSDEMGENI